MIYVRHGSVQTFNSRLPENASERHTQEGREGRAHVDTLCHNSVRKREGGRGETEKGRGRGRRKRGSAYTSNSKSGSTMRFKTLCTNIKSGNLLNAHVPYK
jgi:hypothetical protein